MLLKYTQSADPLAVGKAPNHLIHWQHAETTLEEFITFSYIEGHAFTCGQFDLDSPLEGKEVTHRNSRLWRGSHLIMLDLDESVGIDYLAIIDNPFIKAHALVVMPSSSFTPKHPKAHILFHLDTTITDKATYKRVGEWVAEQLPFKTDKATLTPAQAIYGTAFNKPEMTAHVKGFDDGLLYYNTEATPIDTAGLVLTDLTATTDYSLVSKRAVKHESAPDDLQTAAVLDALSWVLDSVWGEQDRDKRLATIMSAFRGSNSVNVLNRFLDYSSPRWDGSSQRATLSEWWYNHKPRQDEGLTVASLFYEAREKGWLQISSTELTGFETFNSPDLCQWLVGRDLEPVTLIKSGTGTSKTQGAIAWLKAAGPETRAVFFSPSIKLCHALSASLTLAGIENTLYIDDSRKTKDAETLRRAKVLVTTLQTFAVKAFSTANKHEPYDLVVMDECDELLSAFVRSGINNKIAHGSHVDFTQARLGVDALIWLFSTAKQVLMLDGTMTELSRYLALQWANRPVGVYVNEFKRDKAPVTLFGVLQNLRDDIVKEVKVGKRVVIATDTRQEAALVHTLLNVTEAVESDNVIRITSDTAANPKVNEFFRDVERGAESYQVVIYNSAMGSGVSIVNTVPDIVYLIGTYLTPRKLLQLLNRYRVQKEVRMYVQPRENLYSPTVIERFQEVQQVANLESVLLNIGRVKRDSVSQVISEAALIAATDDFEQQRSVRDFFARLLAEDGREVVFHFDDILLYEEETKLAKGLVKELKTEIRKTWRTVAPIKRGDSFPEGLSDDDAARGVLHGFIADVFPHYETQTGIDDLEVANLALNFGKHRGMIKHWMNPHKIIQKTLDELQNSRRDSVTYRLYLSRIELLTQLSVLFANPSEGVNDDDLESRALEFLRAIQARETVFNMVAPNGKSLAKIFEGQGTPVDKALTCAKILLKMVGLTYKRSNGKRVRGSESRIRKTSLIGLNRLEDFTRLCGYDFTLDNFNRQAFETCFKDLQTGANEFNRLSLPEQKDVLATLGVVDVTLNRAVKLQIDKAF